MIDLILICAFLICGVLIALLALANMTLDARLDVVADEMIRLRNRLDGIAKRTEGQ